MEIGDAICEARDVSICGNVPKIDQNIVNQQKYTFAN